MYTAYELANEEYQKENYKEAINLYQNSILDMENFNDIEHTKLPLYNIGVCYIKLKKFGKALKYFKEAIKVDPKYSKAFFNKGFCHIKLNHNKKALVAMNTAWALDNNDKDCEKVINILLKNF
uniref:Putative TPR repeat-containing protein n=1 Tax=Clostridium botulinum TaxID=1491 RepID=A0A077K0E6_CLOBO|nr:tetratricopeptide repeat protein [Clostridium botulinum]BAP25676.1 putative TPR repeat-containing protein [Clostridium botulinum]